MHMSLANLGARPIVALIGFAAWTLLLVVGVLLSRTILVLSGKKRATEFPSGTPHGGDAYWRLNRAHVNALENLLIFAVIVLSGAALGVSSPRLATLATVALFARLAQSFFHLLSGKAPVIILRTTCFVVQLVCFAWMIVETLKLATS